jgi:hypothetical protein
LCIEIYWCNGMFKYNTWSVFCGFHVEIYLNVFMFLHCSVQEMRRTGILNRIKQNAWYHGLENNLYDISIDTSLETVMIFHYILGIGVLISILLLTLERVWWKINIHSKQRHYWSNIPYESLSMLMMILLSHLYSYVDADNVSEVSEVHAASMIRVEVSMMCQCLCMHRVFTQQTEGGKGLWPIRANRDNRPCCSSSG